MSFIVMPRDEGESSNSKVWPLRVLILLQQLSSPPPLPVRPLNRLPITYGLLGSPCRKPTSTWSPTSGMNTKPRFVDTLSLPPPSGVITRIQPVRMLPVCQFIWTWTRPLPSGSALPMTLATCVSATDLPTSRTGRLRATEGIARKLLP